MAVARRSALGIVVAGAQCAFMLISTMTRYENLLRMEDLIGLLVPDCKNCLVQEQSVRYRSEAGIRFDTRGLSSN